MAMNTEGAEQEGLRGKLSTLLSLYRTLANLHFMLVELRASSSSTAIRSSILSQITHLSNIFESGFSRLSKDHQRRLSQAPLLRQRNIQSSSSYFQQSIPDGEQILISLQIVDDILAELLITAKTHAKNQENIEELVRIVQNNDARLKTSIKKMSMLRDKCDRLVKLGEKEIKSMDRAEKNPIPYEEILAYARKLSQTTSAPPGFKLQLDDGEIAEGRNEESAKGSKSIYQKDSNDADQGKAGKIPPQLQDKLPFPSESAMRRSAMSLPLITFKDFKDAFQDGEKEEQEIQDIASQMTQGRPLNITRTRGQAEEEEEGFGLDLN